MYEKELKERVFIKDIPQKVGKEVKLFGFVQTVRKLGKIAFFELRDGTGTIQVGGFSEARVQEISLLNTQDVVLVIGIAKKREEKYINKNEALGEFEVEATVSTHTLQTAETMPFDMGGKELHLELPTLLDNRSLSLRHHTIAPIFKIQETVAGSFRKTLKGEGFTEIFIPTIVSSATEGGAEVFSVDYYGHKTYLAQSPQMYKQMLVPVFERVFTIAHAYRAEPSVTTRHLSEYLSLDAEMGFISSYDDLMDMAEKVVVNMFSDVQKQNGEELKLLKKELPKIKAGIPRKKLHEAQEIISKRKGTDRTKEPDLDPSDEKEICKWAQEETGSPFVFVTHYPTSKRPFYAMPDPKDPKLTLSFDLLGVSEEWVTGGQRINDYQMLLKKMQDRGVDPKKFEIYLQAFKYGMPPEGGFAMGLERIVKDMLGLLNVREASLYPRDMERVDERFSLAAKDPKEK